MKAPQDIVIKPIITERSVDCLEQNKYTFKVDKKANKLEIKKAIEELFDVEVTKVNTMNCRGRVRRVGRFVGKKPDWKKAIVTVNSEPKGKNKKSTIGFFDSLH
ncbi:MAG: 50S ribosomal protein L23 [Clostridiales bacterium]|nr:50S ribosomal protein L23 [Clostridiales bacterium]